MNKVRYRVIQRDQKKSNNFTTEPQNIVSLNCMKNNRLTRNNKIKFLLLQYANGGMNSKCCIRYVSVLTQ